jgi:Flp pilus assembly protein TadG
MRLLARLAHEGRAAVTAEFALVLPLLILFTIGLIDVGRMMWTWNRAEKAAQMGVRYAAVTDMADSGIASYDYYTTGGIPRGSLVNDSSFQATCTSDGCTCDAGATCPGLGTFDDTAFDATVARMQAFMPELTAQNVTIKYGFSGLGYAGDPYGPDINPLITIEVGTPTAVTFRPALGYVFGLTITLPHFASTLSMEDGRHAIAN